MVRGAQGGVHLRVRRPRRFDCDGGRPPQDKRGRLHVERGPVLVRLQGRLRRDLHAVRRRQHHHRAQPDRDHVHHVRHPRRGGGRDVLHGVRCPRLPRLLGGLGRGLGVLGLRDVEPVRRVVGVGQLPAGRADHLHEAEADRPVLQRRPVRAAGGAEEVRVHGAGLRVRDGLRAQRGLHRVRVRRAGHDARPPGALRVLGQLQGAGLPQGGGRQVRGRLASRAGGRAVPGRRRAPLEREVCPGGVAAAGRPLRLRRQAVGGKRR
mmetsp:Transcript_78315/g.210210  ORF Transcript_78315/g.210210 Transcript_78315/m.210210 type:complete len:264 (+) Transcript_78315:548-1339(+)